MLIVMSCFGPTGTERLHLTRRQLGSGGGVHDDDGDDPCDVDSENGEANTEEVDPTLADTME
mgnify:CR=1 FL=1